MKNFFLILIFAIIGFTSCDKEYTVVIKQHTNMISSEFDKEDDTETIKAKDDAEAYRKAFISLVCHAHVKCDLYQYDNPLKFYMILEDKDGNRISHHVVEEKSELLANLLFLKVFTTSSKMQHINIQTCSFIGVSQKRIYINMMSLLLT